jgi:cytoskeletal protein RodZ
MSEEISSSESKSKKLNLKKPNKSIVAIVLVLLFVAAIGSSIYFYKQYKDVKNNPTAAVNEKNSQETEKVLSEVKAVILIDSTEAPTIARVEDPSALQKNNEVFYKNVQKGDYLILYKDRAIIYRESNNQIINVAPIINTAELQQKQAEQTKATTTTTTKKTN